MPTIVNYLQVSPMIGDLEGFLINEEFIFGHSLNNSFFISIAKIIKQYSIN